jgi:hypothetical protein
MIDNITYVNHLNEVFSWGANGVFANYSDLRDFVWSYSSSYDRVSSFYRGIATKNLPTLILCMTEAEGVRIRNNLFEVCEKDVLAVVPGKLIIGDYYLQCYITGSASTEYLVTKRYMRVRLTVTSDRPFWVKETTAAFYSDSSEIITGGTNLDYDFDYPFDYTSELINKALNNTGFADSNFKMVIYGPAVNPIVYIGGHAYEVDTEIASEGYLTINSIDKTILLTDITGNQTNVFNYRSRDSYVFQKIPSGVNAVTWDESFNFDLTLIEERSEPRWT